MEYTHQLVAIFCEIDDSCKERDTYFQHKLLTGPSGGQRGVVETVVGHLKHHYHVWHTRHCSALNAMTHLIAALAAYVIEPLKMSAIRLLMRPLQAEIFVIPAKAGIQVTI